MTLAHRRRQLLVLILSFVLGAAAVTITPTADASTVVLSVRSISPNAGPAGGGTTVTVLGSGFSHVSKVLFGSVAGSRVTVISSGRLTVVAPKHAAGVIDIRVLTKTGSISGASAITKLDRYSYYNPPVVKGISPTSGALAGGTTVTVTGINFVRVTGVVFGTIAGRQVKVLSSSRLTVVAPPHVAGAVDLQVISSFGRSLTASRDRFTYTPGPVVAAVSPSSGSVAGGTRVVVTGTGFNHLSKVMFGGTIGTGLTVGSSTRLTVTAPAHPAGPVDLRISGAYGTSSVTATDSYTYRTPPAVTAIAADTLTAGVVTLRWQNPAAPGEFSGVTIRRALGSAAPTTVGSGSAAVVTMGATNQWTDTGLIPGMTYSYALFANDGALLGMAAPSTITVSTPVAISVEGVVTNSSGAGLPDVVVSVNDADGGRVGGVVTRADGRYTTSGLATGSYTICFTPTRPDGSGHGYRPACNRDASTGAVLPVDVAAGAEPRAVNVVLASAGSISGVVTAGSATPLAGVMVVVADAAGEPVMYDSTDSEGRWSVTGLADGSYTACFDPSQIPGDYAGQCYNAQSPAATPTVIEIDGSDIVTGVNGNLTGESAGGPANLANPDRTSRPMAAPYAGGEVSSWQLVSQPCANVLFMAARGSGESGPGGARDNVNDASRGVGAPIWTAYQAFRARLPDGTTVTPPISVAYPADNVLPNVAELDYVPDLWQGVLQARNALTARATQCPDEQIALAGYSQGAMLMHRILNNATTKGVDAMSTSIISRVVTSILIGDGDRVAADTTTDFGSADERAQGVGTQLDPSIVPRTFPVSLGESTFEVCNSGDVVCDFHVPYLCAPCAVSSDTFGFLTHLGYGDSGVVKDAAGAAAERIASGANARFHLVGGSLPQTNNASLKDVECVSSAACIAVGFSVDGLGADRPLASIWNGHSWFDTRLPTPAGRSARLDHVSCGSNTSCVAVGVYKDGTYEHPYATVWDGSQWNPSSLPLASDWTGRFLSISCPTSSWCLATGESVIGGYGHPFTLIWQGGTWSTAASVFTPATLYSQLSTVACQSPQSCIAIGYYTDSDAVTHALSARWTGESWQALPISSDTFGLTLDCSSAISCIAVAGRVAAFRFNGTSWSAIPTSPIDASSISCSNPSACMVVSDDWSSAAAAEWNGTRWMVTSPVAPSIEDINPSTDVDCVDGQCMVIGVVGFLQTRPWAETWSASGWTVTTPGFEVGAQRSHLSAVSCTSRSFCMAVGGTDGDSYADQHPYAEIWNGSRWSGLLPPFSSTTGAQFLGVSCVASTVCIAVGTLNSGQWAARWDGDRWHDMSPPNLGPGELAGITCHSANWCIAVGTHCIGGTYVTDALLWNGTSWTLLATPRLATGTDAELVSISCPTITHCWASGLVDSVNGERPLLESLAGQSFTALTVPGAKSGRIGSISCPDDSHCVAVGKSVDVPNGTISSTAYAYSAGKWATVSTPSDSQPYSELDGVACSSFSSCVAVGSSAAGYEAGLLVETWNGSTWVSTPLDGPVSYVRPGAGGAFQGREPNPTALAGIDCRAQLHCIAVGSAPADEMGLPNVSSVLPVIETND